MKNNDDRGQTPHSLLGLHCLPLSSKRDARLIWVSYHSKEWYEVKNF